MSENLVDILLSYPGAARVAVWMWLRHPKCFTAREVSEGMLLLSHSRIQQILRWMYSRGLVERKPRETNNPGPEPYEYRLVLPLVNALLRRG